MADIGQMVISRALHKNASLSPQKGRLVADTIRGLSIGAALERLHFSQKKASALIEKLLNSAIANAEDKSQADIDTLYVQRIEVSDGQHMRRIRFGARGRVSRITKQRCHILVELGDVKSKKRGK